MAKIKLFATVCVTDAQNFMLNNKTEAAYMLLSQEQPITVPDYIQRAIEWIRK